MALIFIGKSECAICKQILDEDREFTGFPALINNMNDALYIFSDAGVHTACLEAHPSKDNLLSVLKQYDENIPSPRSRCIVDGELIKTPRKTFTTGLITSDVHEPLFAFNFITLNKDNLSRWDDRDQLITLLQQYDAAGKWDGFAGYNYIHLLLKSLSVGA